MSPLDFGTAYLCGLLVGQEADEELPDEHLTKQAGKMPYGVHSILPRLRGQCCSVWSLWPAASLTYRAGDVECEEDPVEHELGQRLGSQSHEPVEGVDEQPRRDQDVWQLHDA